MLKGDLTSTPLASLLLDLANDDATGCLQVTDSAGNEAQVYLRSGLLYSISVPSSRPHLGAKFVSSGALAPEALAEALEAQRTELQGWRLGELLVHLGYVDEPVVEAFVREQVHESLWDLLRWHEGHWKFKKTAKTRDDVCPPMPVVDLLESLRERGYEWESISAIVHGPNAVPMLSARSDASSSETTLDNDAWSMLCKIDGERTVAELARDCGYTLFEAGNVIVSLVQAGLVDIEEHVDPEGAEPYGANALSSAFSGELDDDHVEEAIEAAEEEDPLAQLARLVSEASGEQPGDGGSRAVAVVPPSQRTAATGEQPWMLGMPRDSSESFAASIARVSGALSEVLGTPPPATDDIDHLIETRRHRPRVTTPGNAEQDAQRRRRLRSAAAAELANAQALADALRPDRDVNAPELPTDGPPKLVDPEVERSRVAAREAEEAERHAAEQAALDAAARFAQAAAEEAERHAAEQEQARLAAEEAQRLAAEEAQRLAAEEAERLAAEEAARLAAEQAAEEEQRIAAERAAAEVEAWDEYWHREEQARLAAEEAQRLAAEEAERLAAEQAQRLAAEEAERQAAEQAAAEEAARLAAEEAARIAAEELAEAQRLAAEQAAIEAARVAAEEQAAQEAARVAAEEAARIAAELEAARLAAEQAAAEEAARQAEAEAARIAAEQAEAERAEKAARRKADKEAAEEAARLADEAAAATAMLIELNASAPAPEPEPEQAAVPEPEPEPEPVGPLLSDPPEFTDTAAILRELSSLGTEEADEQPLAAPFAARAANRPHNGNDKKVKKKIGLFGL
jgi:hypothetical protein